MRTLPATRENSLRSKAYLARTHWNCGGWAGAGWGEEADLAVDEWEDGVGVGWECRWGGEERKGGAGSSFIASRASLAVSPLDLPR